MNQTVQAYQAAQYKLQEYFENKTIADNKTDFTFVIQPFIADAFNPAMNVKIFKTPTICLKLSTF